MTYGMKLAGTGKALPCRLLTNEELENYMQTSREWIESHTGIRQRYLCTEENILTLAAQAAQQAIEQAEKDPSFTREKIRVVLAATSTGYYAFPSVAAMTVGALGLSEHVYAADLSAACTGFIYGLGTAASLLASGMGEYALIIGCEEFSRILELSDRSTGMLFGDGAGAAVIRLEPSAKQTFFWQVWTRGNEEWLSCPGINCGRDVFCPEQKTEPSLIRMNGPEVFRFAVKAIPQAIDQVCALAGKAPADIDHIVCHQANSRIIDAVKKKYPGLEGRFYINIGEYGNTSAASIPIALAEMDEKGLLQSGRTLLTVGFGAGLTWGGALLQL
ncbi:MAG: beta-ketoacyl-ACP synthase 3 [Firmicutes bacterium]|nr:beta-ketoacyl-ACP synthase 3 [Bacillota bacterium]